MENVLDELFSNIADAIRSKTGETDTMKPMEFPDKISSIEAGSGGALPPGVYLSVSPIKSPHDYRHRRFMYNGELYASGDPRIGSNYLNKIYRRDENAWVTVLETEDPTTGINGCVCNSTNWNGAEYNGEFHIFDGAEHWIFNGSTLVESTKVPVTDGETYPAICNEKLYVYAAKTYTLYVWNPETNLWTSVVNYGSVYGYVYGPLLVVNDEMYLTRNGDLYKCSGKTLTYAADSLGLIANATIVNDNIYTFKNNWWYKIDLKARGYIELGRTPSMGTVTFAVGTGDISFTAVDSSCSTAYCPHFVVNIVEASE
jgi:hypothetical protein